MSDFEPRLTDADALALFDKLCNWTRWGTDDQRGTLNHITPAKTAEAARSVRLGRTLSLARDIGTRPATNNPRPAVHIMQYMGENPTGSTDFLGINWHGFSETHIDALCHEFFRGVLYGGTPIADAMFITGAKKGSVHQMKDGIVTRGVMLDIAGAQGRKWLDVGERVHVEDLELAEKRARVQVSTGDAVVLRVGQDARMAVDGIESPYRKDFVRNGVDADCLPWFQEREIAVYVGDCIGVLPSGYPSLQLHLHQIGIVAMGLPMVENVSLDPLAALCDELQQWSFLLTIAPLRLRGGTGSAVNPIAVF